jgi:hypothetical protein
VVGLVLCVSLAELVAVCWVIQSSAAAVGCRTGRLLSDPSVASLAVLVVCAAFGIE